MRSNTMSCCTKRKRMRASGLHVWNVRLVEEEQLYLSPEPLSRFLVGSKAFNRTLTDRIVLSPSFLALLSAMWTVAHEVARIPKRPCWSMVYTPNSLLTQYSVPQPPRNGKSSTFSVGAKSYKQVEPTQTSKA